MVEQYLREQATGRVAIDVRGPVEFVDHDPYVLEDRRDRKRLYG
jgi:hypothetical protein